MLADMGNTAILRADDTASVIRDPAYRGARALLFTGLFFSSFLVLRLGAVTIGDLLLAGAVLLAAFARLANDRVAWAKPAVSVTSTLIALALLLLGSAIAITNAVLPAESALVVVRVLVVIFVLPWLIRILLPSTDELKRAAQWLVVGAATSSGGTILQYFAGPEIIPGGLVSNAGRFTGFAAHVSDTGAIAALGVSLGLGFLITARRRGLWTLVVGVSAIGLILSGSVSGMLAAVAAVVVYVARGALRFRYLLLLAAVATVVVYVAVQIQAAAAALTPIERLQQALGLTNQGQYSTSDSRIETYQAAMIQIAESPIVGRGFDAISSIADGTYPAHNILIGAFYQGGLLVALAFAIVLVRPLTGGWLKLDRSMLTSQVLAAFIAMTFFAMTAPNLFNRYLWLPVALLALAQALWVSENRPAPAIRNATRSSPRSAELRPTSLPPTVAREK